jgi:hypothetical protein
MWKRAICQPSTGFSIQLSDIQRSGTKECPVNRLHKIALIALLLVSVSSLLPAQGGATGAISGTLLDAHGAVIAGAKVSIVSQATGQTLRELTTDSTGVYTAPLLPAGTYAVEVSAQGFATTKINGVVVRVTETARLSNVLKPSAVKEEVEVHSDVVAIDTTNAATGESIATETVSSLPLATRNFQQLLDLSAGATASLNNAAALGRGDVRIDVNGGREDNNNYLIEGISASDYAFGELTFTPVPNPDSIQEFKVGTSLYDSTQGRNGGGNINAILKSGTAQYHGALWEYFRNTSLDADDYFLGKFVLKQNIFGGDVGGPLGTKGKLGYFYVNYQGTRQRSGDSLGTYISGAAVPVLPGNRSCANLVSTFFPAGLPSYANTGNSSCGLDPVAVNLLNAKGNQFGASSGGYLLPTVAPSIPGSATGSLTLSDPGKYTEDQFIANWDRDFNHGKDRVSGRFFWSDANQTEPFGADNLQVQTGYPAASTNLNFPLAIPLRGRFGSVSETHTFSNTLLNEFRFGINVISDSLQNVPVPGASTSDLGIANGSGASDMYRFEFASGLQVGPFPNQGQTAVSDSYVWLDTLSWTRGRHFLRFGGEFDHTSIDRNLPVLNSGLLFFIPGADGALNDFQNFLLGEPTFGEAGGGASNHQYKIPGYSLFAQDDYRLTQSLTLNLGFRTEWVGAPYDDLCHLGNAIPENANLTGNPFVYPSCVSKFGISGLSGTLNKAALKNEYATVPEPRIGLAYDLGGKHNTVVRAGYGIYSVREDIGAVDNLSFTAPIYPVLVAGGAPEGLSSMFSNLPGKGQVNGTFLPTPSIFQGFGGGPTSGSPVFSGTAMSYISLAVPLHWIVPTTQQWNLTVQRQLGRDWMLEVGYVGTKGTHLRSVFDPDQPNLASPGTPITLSAGGTAYPVTTNTTANVSARAPYLGIAPDAFEAFYPNSDSHYSGLQVTASHHFTKGLYFQSAYTYSKSIDDVSTASVAFLTRINNQNDARASRGLSDFDRRQRFVTSFNYALPFFPKHEGLAGKTLGGWETDAVIVLQSGSPITIADGSGGGAYALSSPVSTASFAPGFGCGNALTSGSLSKKIANWVNPAAYVPAPLVANNGGDPLATGYGDSPRNCIVGPAQANVDFTLGKTFKLTETQSLRFRTEVFNLFNHPSFQNPQFTGTANVEAPQIAQITNTVGTPRLIQFSLKYMY